MADGSHEDGAEGGAEAGGDGDGGERHAGLGEDGGVDEDDVGHGDEGGEAGEELGAPGGAVVGEAEVQFETGSHRLSLTSGGVRFGGWLQNSLRGFDDGG